MVTSTSRQRILNLLGRRGTATSAEIAHALNMSAPAVRHHLAILVQDGRVERAGTQPKSRRGRPHRTFRLSERVLGDNLAKLSDATLQAWMRMLPEEARDDALQRVGQQLGRAMGSVDASLPAPRRLDQAAEKLNVAHYRARWEAGASGPRLLLGHCPYATIIELHPELCGMDAALLQTIVDAPVEQLAKIDPQGRSAYCIFAVRQRASGRVK
ncbi:MAG: helix-turn-helix transcriptional regulator [Anaerolineae bacterium]